MEQLFKKKVKTQQEKDALVEKARAEWNRLGEHQHLVAANDEEYLSAVSDSIEVEEHFVSPEPLTGAAKAKFESDLTHATLMDRVFRVEAENVPIWYRKTHEAEEHADFEKLVGPGRRAAESLDEMVRKAIDRAMEKSSGGDLPPSGLRIRPIPQREGLLPMLRMAAEENPDSDLTRFLTAFVSGDEQAQRRIARELAVA